MSIQSCEMEGFIPFRHFNHNSQSKSRSLVCCQHDNINEGEAFPHMVARSVRAADTGKFRILRLPVATNTAEFGLL